ncbi:MAG: hypothetical protein AAF942_12800, partial [Pseudomonadota bacterium]
QIHNRKEIKFIRTIIAGPGRRSQSAPAVDYDVATSILPPLACGPDAEGPRLVEQTSRVFVHDADEGFARNLFSFDEMANKGFQFNPKLVIG